MSERLGDRVANTAVVAPLSIDMFPILIRRRLGQDGMGVMRRSFIAQSDETLRMSVLRVVFFVLW
jgi:hypothetical protein